MSFPGFLELPHFGVIPLFGEEIKANMVKQIIRKHIKKIAVGILIILALALVINIYGDFVQPFIDPYFFKIGNIEKIVGAKLPSAFMLEYDIIPEPSYRFAGTKGIKEIFATVQINES